LGVATEQQIVDAKLAQIQFDLAKGIITVTEATKAEAIARKEAAEAAEALAVRTSRLPELTRFAIDASKGFKQFDQLAVTTFTNFENAIADVAVGTTKLSDAFKKMIDSIIRDLIRLTIRMAVTGPLAGALQGLFGSITGPAAGITTGPTLAQAGRQHGGSVMAGRSYIVGEAGPELFVPKSAGNIVPSITKGGMPGELKVIVNNYTSGQTETTQERRSGPSGEELIIGIVKRVTASGELDSANRARFGLRANKVR